MLYIASDRAWEVLLNGQLLWASPLDSELRIHHEVFPMPNGNVLAVMHDYKFVNVETSPSVFEDQWWKGDKMVELNRDNNKIAWEWSTWDDFSLLDFDPTVMASPTTGAGEPVGGSYPQTHANSVVYDASDDSIYVSSRHLSRVTKIDRSTKQVIYNMGFEAPYMPSGDVDFGDDLFSWQHSLEMQPNGNMLVYDNGNRRGHVDATEGTGISKVIELQFSGDPIDSASIVWSWTVPDYQRAVGDGDRLANGNTLVVAGVTGEIYEVTSVGDIVWQLELPTGSPDYLIYRAERIPYLVSDTAPRDTDFDTVTDYLDNCPEHVNVGQVDRDQDGFGDICALAYGVGIFALPSLSPVGFVVLIMVLVAATLAASRATRVA
jgi:hypothetical protein